MMTHSPETMIQKPIASRFGRFKLESKPVAFVILGQHAVGSFSHHSDSWKTRVIFTRKTEKAI
jgi:hypothetical protein